MHIIIGPKWQNPRVTKWLKIAVSFRKDKIILLNHTKLMYSLMLFYMLKISIWVHSTSICCAPAMCPAPFPTQETQWQQVIQESLPSWGSSARELAAVGLRDGRTLDLFWSLEQNYLGIGYGIKKVFSIWDLPNQRRVRHEQTWGNENGRGEGQQFALSTTGQPRLSVTPHWPLDIELGCVGAEGLGRGRN